VPLGTEVGLIPSDFMLDVAPAPLPKNGAEPPSLPIFGPCPLWPNGWMDQDSIWHGGGPWSAPHCARWGPSSPPQKGAGPLPAFAAHFYCGQMARCIKMPLGMEVVLSPGDFVLHGDPVPSPEKGTEPPNFRPTSIVAKRVHGSRCRLVRR